MSDSAITFMKFNFLGLNGIDHYLTTLISLEVVQLYVRSFIF